jgi:putative nucleotidyltransferase with HDIG domain
MRIDAVFPEIEAIENETLRANVASAWTIAAEENGIEIADLGEVPWFPPAQTKLGIDPDAATLVGHVRDVTACALSLAETVSDRRPGLDLDTVLAGALVHDVSKPYEFDGMEETEIGGLLGHPYFGVAVAARAGLPAELLHVVLSHTHRTAVEPATLPAEIVRRADEVAAAAIRAPAIGDLREA